MERLLAGVVINLSAIPSDALASELMRRDRIKWFHAQAVVDEKVLHSAVERSAIVQRYREDMVHQINQYMLSQNLFLFRQEHDPTTEMMKFHLSLPVFIRT